MEAEQYHCESISQGVGLTYPGSLHHCKYSNNTHTVGLKSELKCARCDSGYCITDHFVYYAAVILEGKVKKYKADGLTLLMEAMYL